MKALTFWVEAKQFRNKCFNLFYFFFCCSNQTLSSIYELYLQFYKDSVKDVDISAVLISVKSLNLA